MDPPPDARGARVDPAAAYEVCERLRWPDTQPRCPHCGGSRCYFLRPVDGCSRRTRAGHASQRRVWKCAACRRQFSALTGTALHATKVPLPVWLAVAAEWAAAGEPPTPGELARRHGMSRDTARRVARLLSRTGDHGPPGLSTLLTTSGSAGRRVRDASAVRRAPRPQRGPSAEYGS